ncbi:hypothetical protein EUTSA_v10015275mg, partial [Eutrema salsugineum]
SDNGARWIKTKVNVEDHIENGQGFVDDYVSRLTMKPLDRSRPLWDIHILNVKTSDAEAVCVMRCNHSLGDGMSLMSLLVACTLKASNPDAFLSIPAIKRREHFLSIFVIHYVVSLIWNTIVDLLQVSATVLFLKDTKTPLKNGGGSAENNPMRFYHRSLSLDDIRFIKNAMDMVSYDLLSMMFYSGITQTAISRYLNRQYGNTNVEGGTSTSDLNNIPSKTRLRALIPVNLRQEIGIQPVAKMLAKGSKCRWGNYNGLVHFPLSISLETDPLVNLSKTKSIMDRKKHSLMAALVYSNNEFIFNIFGPKVGAVLFNRTMSNTTTMFSNIVGPVEKVSLHGNQIAYIAVSAYGKGNTQALLIHFISYAEKMIISIGVDPTVIPDPHIICDEMEESLKAIKEALSVKNDIK